MVQVFQDDLDLHLYLAFLATQLVLLLPEGNNYNTRCVDYIILTLGPLAPSGPRGPVEPLSPF